MDGNRRGSEQHMRDVGLVWKHEGGERHGDNYCGNETMGKGAADVWRGHESELGR